MSDQQANTLMVEAIHSGTVIDHIPVGMGLVILNRLQLKDSRARLTVGLNLPSRTNGLKDLIKIDQWAISEQDAAELALFAPAATVNIIAAYQVVKKFPIQLPAVLEDVLVCPNANCITHNEPVISRFQTTKQDKVVNLRCHYCERSFADSLFMQQRL